MIFTQLLPCLLVFLWWILVYKIWLGTRLIFVFIIFIRRDRLLRSCSPELSPVIQIAVIPFEIDVPRHMNLDDCARPTVLFLEVVFEELDVIFANGRRKQLAQVCQGIMKVVRSADLLRIDDPAHPYFL